MRWGEAMQSAQHTTLHQEALGLLRPCTNENDTGLHGGDIARYHRRQNRAFLGNAPFNSQPVLPLFAFKPHVNKFQFKLANKATFLEWNMNTDESQCKHAQNSNNNNLLQMDHAHLPGQRSKARRAPSPEAPLPFPASTLGQLQRYFAHVKADDHAARANGHARYVSAAKPAAGPRGKFFRKLKLSTASLLAALHARQPKLP
eukprot:1137313-Pelagomonas_calceolata.AAC.4